VLRDLGLDRDQVSLLFDDVTKCAQENRLTDTAQTDHDHRLAGVPLLHATQQYAERFELMFAAGQISRRGTSVRRVRVVLGPQRFTTLLRFIVSG
jgi:hypothetical protein